MHLIKKMFKELKNGIDILVGQAVFKGRSWPCILFIDKLAYVTFNVFTSLCYNGISQ